MNKEEAIKIVRSHYPANKQMLNEALEFLIPELKVSEDELTWLKNYISEEIYYLSMDIRDNEDMDIRDDEDIIKLQKLQKSLAWLEKQGKNNIGISESTRQKLEDNLNKALEKETPESWNEFLDKQGEQKPVEWSEEEQQIIKDAACVILACVNTVDTREEEEKLEELADKLQDLKPHKQGERKPTDKIQIGKEYKCIASPRYSTFMIGKIYKPEDRFLCKFMNLCSDCFEPIEDSEQNVLAPNIDKVEPKFKVGDIIHCKLDNRTFVIKEVDLKKGVYIYTEKGCGNDINYADEMFELVEPNPYSGTSFVYNNHTWGMCARDGGVDILCDSKLIKHVDKQKPTERKEFVLASFGTDIKLENDTIIIPDGYIATIEGNKIHIKKEGKTALEAIKEEKVDNANKVEPKFKVGDWVVVRGEVILICDIRNSLYDVMFADGEHRHYDTNILDKDKEAHLWAIDDAEDGDILYSKKHNLLWRYKNTKECYYCINLNYSNNVSIGDVIVIPNDVRPACKEQRDLLSQKLKETGYEWDTNKKKLKKLN